MFSPKTPHYNERKAAISMLIIHGTEVDDAATRAILEGKAEREASAHYYIDDKGAVTQYLDESVRAWHAGLSYWEGVTDINSASIGIELLAISNDGSFSGPETFYTDAQIASLVVLAKEICARHNIAPHHVLAHEDIAPKRRLDPGKHFPWEKLAEQGVGLWHELAPVTHDPVLKDDAEIIEVLGQYGYDTRPEMDRAALLKAFQTHFLPWNICGQPTPQAFQAAKILVTKKFKL